MNIQNKNKIIFSGIQPSGELHLGNYLGAIRQWVEAQDEYECIYCVVDYHAITVKQDPAELRRRILDNAKIYIASGIDSKRCSIFKQSDISEHTELGWILNCIARTADLDKMTQFKDKSVNKETVSVGLYSYPVLMAADILLYGTDVVPVGDDQVQHVELARTLARRFNRIYGEVFKVPVVRLQKTGARIMGLDDASKKMSKSSGSNMGYIGLLDDPEVAVKKIMKAVTDSEGVVEYDLVKKPEVSNLLTIYSLLSGRSIEGLVEAYAGKQYGEFKKDLASVVSDFLFYFQEKYNKLSDEDVIKVLNDSVGKVKPIASAMMREVKHAIGVDLKC